MSEITNMTQVRFFKCLAFSHLIAHIESSVGKCIKQMQLDKKALLIPSYSGSALFSPMVVPGNWGGRKHTKWQLVM